MSVPAYAEYKDSGVAWLGAVPSHWDVTRLKQICKVFPSNVDKKTVDGEEPIRLCNYTDVYYNDVILSDHPFMKATATKEQISRFSLLAGDTIITKDSESSDDIARSSYVPANLPGIVCGYHLSLVRPRPGTHGAFIKRYFESSPARAYFDVGANGLTRVGLGQYVLDNAPIALPPVAEQTAIATFLDRETAKIDALVAEQERLIALLKEKRQAVISHAVTKGLNPNAPMKDSGIEWLGEIPAHWETMALKRLGTLRSGEAITSDAIEEEGQYPVFGGNGFRGFTTDYTHIGEYVLIGRQGALCGNINYANGDFWASEHAIVVNPQQEYSLTWLGELLRHMNLGQYSQSAAQPGLSAEFLSNLYVPVPPLSEQQEIGPFLAEKIAQSRELTTEAQAAIALLQERRAALISAAVTGKIDVRGLVMLSQELEVA